jgi:hypothetical protein
MKELGKHSVTGNCRNLIENARFEAHTSKRASPLC